MNKKTTYMLLVYISTVAVLLFYTLINQRDYQDSWILQDILIPTLLYIFIFSLIAVTVENGKTVALVCSSFIIILNTIPNLKYRMFHGTYDSVGHFGFTENLISLGYVPQTGVYSSIYSDFPGMHLFIGTLSLITAADVNVCIKIVTSMLFGNIPLLIYLVTNRIFDKDVQKYIIVSSGLPLVMSYTLFGTTFGIILFCSFFCILFRKYLSNENQREYALTLMVTALGLLFSHAVTTLFLILCLCSLFILMKFIGIIRKTSSNILSYTTIGIITLFSLSLMAWLIFKANFVFEVFLSAFQRVFAGRVIKTPIPERFFEIPLSEQLKIFTLKYIKDAVILVLSLAGFLILIKKFKYKNGYLFDTFFLSLICLIGAISLFLAIQFVIRFGEIEYRRFIDYAMLFSPFFAGLFLWHINEHFKAADGKEWFSRLIMTLILFLCISISIIQVFPYQPLVPRANILSNDLPESEFIVDLRMINTIYQIKMIQFAEKFASKDAKITSDRVTRWQIFGFTNQTFSSRHVYYSPLQPEENAKIKKWNIFLLHYNGKSGPLNEKVEYRTREVINEIRNTLGNTIYDNGESFIISR
jgi:hypothetical protein